LKETTVAVSSASSSTKRRRDRAAAAAVAVVQIFETAPTPERREAIEAYLRDEFIEVRRQARTDCEFLSGSE
jgi:adenosylmethionine-8-amino-7-oxononanoate aminotransferase